MTTAAENERLGVLESEVGHIKGDVTEIKADVKTLVANQTQIAIDLAASKAAEAAITRSRSQTGVWLRFFSERALALIAIAISAYAALRG